MDDVSAVFGQPFAKIEFQDSESRKCWRDSGAEQTRKQQRRHRRSTTVGNPYCRCWLVCGKVTVAAAEIKRSSGD